MNYHPSLRNNYTMANLLLQICSTRIYWIAFLRDLSLFLTCIWLFEIMYKYTETDLHVFTCHVMDYNLLSKHWVEFHMILFRLEGQKMWSKLHLPLLRSLNLWRISNMWQTLFFTSFFFVNWETDFFSLFNEKWHTF